MCESADTFVPPCIEGEAGIVYTECHTAVEHANGHAHRFLTWFHVHQMRQDLGSQLSIMCEAYICCVHPARDNQTQLYTATNQCTAVTRIASYHCRLLLGCAIHGRIHSKKTAGDCCQRNRSSPLSVAWSIALATMRVPKGTKPFATPDLTIAAVNCYCCNQSLERPPTERESGRQTYV